MPAAQERQETGREVGHAGETLHLVAQPDAVVAHWPTLCSTFQTSLDEVEAMEAVARDRRQVQDLLPIRLRVTEHQAPSVRCPSCQQMSAAAFPAETPSRTPYGPRLRALVVYLVGQQCVPHARARDLLADLTGARLSTDTPVEWAQQSAKALEPVEAEIKQALQQVAMLHIDETGVRRSG